ncbi:MFS transporter [Pontibacillus salipaludis]|uniref:MFS transporter n=1 Tax=Pontibacillus salipaludis TaxID=1697394 RepID=UPI0031ED53BD
MMKNSFRLLWSGQMLANLGDVLYIVGIITFLYASTESAFVLAMLPFLNTFGRFMSGMVSPILMNRYPLKTLLVASQVSKTVVLSVLATWNTLAQVPILFLFVFILSIALLDGWALPATDAMLPRLVKKEELVKANSFVSIVTESTQLGGWAIGGLLASLIGGQNLIWLTFILFVTSTVLLNGVRDPIPFKKQNGKKRMIGELNEGFNVIWRSKLFRVIHIEMGMQAIANVVWVAAIIYVYVEEVLDRSEAWWGYLNTCFFLGMIAGGYICARYHNRLEHNLRSYMVGASFVVVVVTLSFGFNQVAWIAFLLAFLHGIFGQVKGVALNTFLQKEATDEQLPKIYGLQSGVFSLIFGVSTLLFGALTEWFGVQYVFLISGILLWIGTIYLMFNRLVFPKYTKAQEIEAHM